MRTHTKQILSVITGLSFSALAPAAIAIGTELITDGSFENVSGPFGGGNANRLYIDRWFAWYRTTKKM